jgi:4-hydroxy-3-methylbut-2-en-1-yl diphosphate synthase IspG/GcpE
VRVNPGNIKEFDGGVGEVAKAAAAAGTPIRIGVNAGSLDKRFMQKYGKATPEALVKSRALWACSVWSREPLQITAIEAMARVVSSTAAFASGRKLKLETEPARVVSG